MSKPAPFNASEMAKIGESNRIVNREQSLPVAPAPTPKRPGRQPKFTEETGRLNAFIPLRLLEKIQEQAWRQKKTLSQLVAELIEKM